MTFVVWSIAKATVVLCVAWLLSKAMHRGPASTRHLLWTASLVAAILLPVLAPLVPAWTVSSEPLTAAEAVAPVPAAAAPQAAGPPSTFPWGAVVGAVWGAGFLAFALRAGAGAARAARMLRGSTEPSTAEVPPESVLLLGIRRRVRVLESGEAAVPMALGVFRPVIVLPRGASGWQAPRLRSVLLHELAHIARLDAVSAIVARAACCLYWFHPLVWMAARRLRDEQERACDDAVLRLGIPPADYAGHLVETARAIPSGALPAPAMAEMSGLEARVRSLLDGSRSRSPVTRRAAVALAAVTIAVLVPIAAFRADAQANRGTLAGVVKDPSGGVIPGCSVTAKNLGGSNQEIGTANAAGEFRFTAIPAGRYRVEFAAPGFRLLSKELAVEAGQAVRADVVLDIGSVSERIVVTGKGAAAPAPLSAGPPRRIRVGGNVQATKLLKMTRPAYPEELQRIGVEGSVLLRAVISVDGTLLNLAVANTDVHPGLAKAATDAVSQWRYQPTLLNGQPVEVVTTITVAFQLER